MQTVHDQDKPDEKLVTRALRLLAAAQRANRAYYVKNRERIVKRSAAYWEAHKDDLNARRREQTKARVRAQQMAEMDEIERKEAEMK